MCLYLAHRYGQAATGKGLDILSISLLVFLLFVIATNGFGLGEGGDFHHKCVCGELNRHFCQTRVSGLFLI
jgi:hypothetical protein